MAFVYRSTKFPKIDHNNIPGPGSYSFDKHIKSKSPYCPFITLVRELPLYQSLREWLQRKIQCYLVNDLKSIGPGQYLQAEKFKPVVRHKDTEPKSLSINTQDYGVVVILKPTPIGFNSQVQRFKKSIGRQVLPGNVTE